MSAATSLRFFRSPEAVDAGVTLGSPRPGDAGFDLPTLSAITLAPGEMCLLRTGLHVEIPQTWVGIVRDRSSVALRGGAVTAGVIDSSYRGEIKIVMHNLGREPLIFSAGDRVAQLLVVPHLTAAGLSEVSSRAELDSTTRDQSGFGSTGS